MKTKTEKSKVKKVSDGKTLAQRKQSKASYKTKTAAKPNSLTPRGELSVSVFDISGKSQGKIALPKEIFGVKLKQELLAQAIRVYFANQSFHKASTKTRGEVRGGGAKPWRQKGTGRARAGSIRSPIWVGGGITFGPRPRKVRLKLPQKMRRQALISALSQQRLNGAIRVISNFQKLEPRTKIAVNLFRKLSVSGKILVILEDSKSNVKLAVRNIPQASVETVDNLNVYKVLTNQTLLLSKDAIEKLRSL